MICESYKEGAADDDCKGYDSPANVHAAQSWRSSNPGGRSRGRRRVAAELVQPYRNELYCPEGFFQGGVIGVLADFAAGAAAGSLLPEGWQNATVGYTVKVVAPGADEELVERGEVIKPGRTLTVVAAEVYASAEGREALCATALVTFRNLRPSGRT